MRHFATRFRYSRWDGTQALDISADDVLAAIADDLTEYGDLRWALRNLMSRGMRGGDHPVQGLRDIMRKLRDRRRERLEQFDLSSVMRDIEQQLARIVEMEQDTIDEWVDRDDDEYADRVLKEIAERNQEALDDLPDDAGGKMKTLEGYEFLNPDAQRKFLELLNQLRKAMTQTFFNDIERMVNQMSGEDIKRMKDMIKALNEMLTRKVTDQDPRFDDFMRKFGDMFGDNPPESLDDLLEQMRRQMAAAQSMLSSLSPQQREQLQSLMSDRFGDSELEEELVKLAREMDFLNPEGKRYVFSGGEELDLEAAMRLMGEMGDLDQLIEQVREAERSGDVERIDQDALRSLLDDESADSLDNLKELLKALRDAGYIRDGDRWELTPRGARMIGQKALGEIYARLRRATARQPRATGRRAFRRPPGTDQDVRVRRPVPPAHAAHYPQRHRSRGAVNASAAETRGFRGLSGRNFGPRRPPPCWWISPGPWPSGERSRRRRKSPWHCTTSLPPSTPATTSTSSVSPPMRVN